MTIKTFTKKILHLLQKSYLNKFKINNCMYFIGDNISLQNTKKIVMYFPDYEFMHFGDHFFFEPLANSLNQKFDFKIVPIKAMEFYFDKLDYKLGSMLDLDTADLIITRKEFYDELKSKKNVLYIDLASLEIERFVCDEFVYKTSDLLKIEYNKHNKPQTILTNNAKIDLNPNQKYILFNNYVDSASYRLRKQHFTKLNDFCRNFALENDYKVIHIGSQKDKDNDKKNYDFIDIDLRGKTSIEDLFSLSNLNNIVNCISFDTFLMHIFATYDKKSYIMFRGRFTKKGYDVIVNNFLPPFKSDIKLIELI